jgi:iron complex outermembrane receptor protein
MKTNYRAALLCASSLSLFMATAASAADTPPPTEEQAGLEDIVVTAEKRETRVQTTPLAITAMNQDMLISRNIANVADLASYVPGFHFGETFGQPKLSIRGISYSNLSTGAEASVAMNINGIYVSRPAGQLGSFFDIAQVEVLRGPQGTLYGRNATGGAVNVTTGKPTEDLSGYARLSYGNYNDVVVEGAVSGALDNDGKILVRLAGMSENRDGYGKNLTTDNDVDDRDTKGVRGTLTLKPVDGLNITLSAEYNRQKDHSGAPHMLAEGGKLGEPGALGDTPLGIANGGSALFRSRDTLADQDTRYHREGQNYSADISYDLGSNVMFRSLTGYRKLNWQLTSDLDQTSFPFSVINYDESSEQFSQELNLSGKSSVVDWTVGLYYFDEKLEGQFHIPQFYGAPDAPGVFRNNYAAGGDLKTKAYAAFGQATFHATDTLSLIVGGRYSHEKKSEDDRYVDFANATRFLELYDPDNPPFAPTTFYQSKSWNSFTPKVGIQFQATPDTMAYATVSRGFKAGLYNLGGTSAAAGNPLDRTNPVLNPEKVWAYEAGLKSTFLHNRARLNLAGFYYDYTGLQVSKATDFTIIFSNAASAEIYGLELEGDALLTDQLRLRGSASWLHARFKEFDTLDPSHPSLGVQDLSGNTLSQAPDFTARLGLEYTLPVGTGSVIARVEGNYTSRTYFSEFNLKSVSQPEYAMADGYLTYRSDGGWQVMGFVKNITNKKVLDFNYQSTPTQGDPLLGWFAPPRTYGVQFRYDF